MKEIRHLLLLFVIGISALASHGQSLVEWPLNASTDENAVVPAIHNNALSASKLNRGNGISNISTSNIGSQTSGWTEGNAPEAPDYYEVCITPKAGVTLLIDGLHFKESRDIYGIRAFKVLWSADKFQSSYLLDQVSIPDNDLGSRTHNLTGLNIAACNDAPVCFRWYGFRSVIEGYGKWRFHDNSLRITGQVVSACTPPSAAPSVSFSDVSNTSLKINIDNGGGTDRLVVLRAGAPVSGTPCNTVPYIASSTFGLGDEIANEEYVVYSGAATAANATSIVVDGLKDGVTYHVAVFEYNSANYCYQWAGPARDDRSTDCVNPAVVERLLGSSADMEIALAWDMPSCYDELLVLGSANSFAGTPTGDGTAYQANEQLGLGTHTNGDFLPTVYPVYKGSGDQVAVGNLVANQSYYFRVYTRRGNTWTAGPSVTKKAVAGCPDIGGDVVFINELHYFNFGMDQDEGIEIYGPAGTDLSAYAVYFYAKEPLVAVPQIVVYASLDLSGVIPNQVGGYGTVWFSVPGLADGQGAVALYNKATRRVVEFLSYRVQGWVAADGVAAGMTATAIRNQSGHFVSQNGTSSTSGQSLQRLGNGLCPSTHSWDRAPQTRGGPNGSQAPLPISLLDFSAVLVGGQVKLLWRTASELNNDYMTVERSADGRAFSPIGQVNGAGTSTTPRDYHLWDYEPLPGRNYYRLTQTDFDGTVSYHRVVVVNIDRKGAAPVLSPTLAAHAVQVSFGLALPTEGRLVVVDQLGRTRQQHKIAEGTVVQSLEVSSLERGHYFVRIEYGNQAFTERFVKL